TRRPRPRTCSTTWTTNRWSCTTSRRTTTPGRTSHRRVPGAERAEARGDDGAAVEGDELDVRDGHRGRCARDVAEERDLPEPATGTERASEDLHRPRLDDVEPVTGLTLTDDRRPRPERCVDGLPGEPLDHGLRQRGEHRDAPQERRRLGGGRRAVE